MSNVPPESESPRATEPTDEPTPLVEPAPLVEPTPLVESTKLDESTGFDEQDRDAEPAHVDQPDNDHQPAQGDHRDVTTAAEAAPAPELLTPPPAEPAPVQTVYVTAPTPPKRANNRGIGALLAVLGAIAFALLHSMITAIAYVSAGRSFDLSRFVVSTGFLVPTLVFLVVFVLAVLLINRSGWWAWVLGSLVVAAVTYFASIGIIMLLGNVVAMTPTAAQAMWEALAVSAPMVVAIVVAREVAVWFGLAIAARGRRVKVRNVEAHAAYERELADNRARYGA
jgi:hypothetical protein